MAHHLTTCTFCGAGCGLYLETSGNRIVGAYPSMSHPTNRGKICVRGWHVHEVAGSPDRLLNPLVKRNGKFEEVSWEEAIAHVAGRIKEIRDRDGPDALAFLNSPRCSNEETYLLQKLARAVVGTNNVDHGTGVYSNNSIHVLLEMLGVAAATNSIGELACSETIIVDGVDLGRQLPTIGGAVIRAARGGAKLIVIDTRHHRVAESASLFLQLRPGTESLLYGAMAKVIVDRGLMNTPFIQSRCQDYEAFLSRLGQFDLLNAAEDCGVPAERIEAAALAYARSRSAAILYSTGIEARDASSVQALVNLALLTGHLGREGSGIFPLTEHNNLQGVCDMGMLPDRLPGYRPVGSAAARSELEKRWRARLPAQPGLAARPLLTDRGQGRVKGLWLCRYDPVSTAFFGEAESTLDQLDLVVVQHIFMTDTARRAHVILPTPAFGEERVTFTSTDRRIQIADKVIDPPPGPVCAWQQIAWVARALGADWGYASTASVMNEICEAVPPYGGATHENLARDYGRQWPCTKDRPLGTSHLFDEGHPAAPFRFAAIERPPPPPVSKDYPFALVFGHSLYYWHQNVLVQHSETLKREYRILLLDYPDGFVEINQEDARRLGIRDGERIRLRGPCGSAVSAARVTPEVGVGTIHVPYFVRQAKKQILGADGGSGHLAAVRVEKEVA